MTMVRKTPANKCASAARGAQPPPLSKVLMQRWFANKEVWRNFQNFYYKMPILKPRYLTVRAYYRRTVSNILEFIRQVVPQRAPLCQRK
ncbi:hypothetical protein PIB30_087571, partial [Stylosanthes scabra]|nr:hypothetical protein [Stylosanthes scabra]